jgi:TetR/AcrR family tetracycline transcriptional repressor
MKEDKRQRDLARIEAMQRRAYLRLEHQRLRMDRRFHRMRERLQEAGHEPNDSQRRIIHAALELLNEDGLANMSLRKLAGKVDMQAPALYWHFKNKDVLIDYMAEAILHEEFRHIEARQADEPWQDWLIRTMNRLRQAMLAYKDGARVVAGAHLYPAFTLGKIFDASLRSLHTAGFDMLKARQIMMTAATYTFGYVIEEQASPTPQDMQDFGVQEFMDELPAAAAAVEAARSAGLSDDDDYNAGLGLIIHGVTQS